MSAVALLVVGLDAGAGAEGAARLAGRVAGFLDIRAKRYGAVVAVRPPGDGGYLPALDAALRRHIDAEVVAVTADAFRGDVVDAGGLAPWLEARPCDGVEVLGLTTEGAVRATVLGALDAGLAASVLTDLCVPADAVAAGAALEEMAAAGADLRSARPGTTVTPPSRANPAPPTAP